MSPSTFQRIGVVANLEKQGVSSLLHTVIPAIVKQGLDVFVDPEIKSKVGDITGIEFGIPDNMDMIAALGGDGTILKVARQFVEQEIPILGIKGGSLGFLTEGFDEASLRRITNGDVRIQERMRIVAMIMEGKKEVQRFSALNDVVVHGAGFSRMATLRTELDATLIREYRADGVILATPTGSTAYSLSAGGPLLAPTIEAIVLTPLCPHTLSVRPIVLDAGQRVAIRVVSSDTDARVTVDGQEGYSLEEGQHVVVRKSDKVTKLIVPEDYDFFNLLREKL